MTIISTNNPSYQLIRQNFKNGMHNGAYYYSQEIVKNIIPYVKTTRNWDTLGMRGVGSLDHSIVFLHHGINHDKVYNWLNYYEDQILVCSTYETLDWAKSKGKKAIFLPLSIDVEYVKQFRTKKTKRACYAGNRWAFKREDEDKNIPSYVDFPPKDISREEMLKFIAEYRELYAIGRCALEGLVLGCKIKPFFHKYMNPDYWKILDNKEAAKMLQEMLDEIDKQ